MKKVLAALAALALVVWVVSWFRTPEAVATSAARPWPGGMGRLDALGGGSASRETNEAAARLSALAASLPETPSVEEFVAREIARGELMIGEPPELPDVSAIRELVMREPLVWEHRHEIGDAQTIETRSRLMRVARALVAHALAKARAKERAAWDDLLAVWKLARSLDGHPQMMMQTAALGMARMINGAAWKMPLPAPAWLGEVRAYDHVEPLLRAFQHQAAWYWKSGAEIFPTKWLADSVEHDRRIAEALVRTTACDVNAQMNDLGTDLRFVWRRAFRYRAEREATANALRVREGKPIEPASACSDGSWSFDGTMLRFSREIPTAPPDRPMPLALRVE